MSEIDILGAKLKALLGAIPAWGAAVQGVLVAFAAGVVPLLPLDVGVKVATAVASLVAVVASVVRVVASVTPVPPSAQGLLMPPGKVLDVDVSNETGRKIAGIRTTA